MLPHNATAVVARNETWTGKSASEPYECGWAREAIVFLRALDAPRNMARCSNKHKRHYLSFAAAGVCHDKPNFGHNSRKKQG